MSIQKAKGTRAETWLTRECQAWGLYARRNDMGQGHGDVELYPANKDAVEIAPLGTAVPNWVVVQVKDNKDYNRTTPPTTWLDQAQVQAAKADAALGILVVKPAGIGYRRVPDWHAWLDLSDLLILNGVTDSRTPLDAWHAPVRVPFGGILILLGGTAPT